MAALMGNSVEGNHLLGGLFYVVLIFLVKSGQFHPGRILPAHLILFKHDTFAKGL